jgi:ketol-acid reductoisomerase
MPTRIFSPQEIDRSALANKRVAILGYGAQGRAHALNLRDSGVALVVGQRPGVGFQAAVDDGFQPVPIADAVAQADVINLLLPDEVHGQVFRDTILPALGTGQVMMACHGFSFHYGLLQLPTGVDFVLVAPKGAGPQVRRQFELGGGVPCLIATAPNSLPETLQVGLAYAAALGGDRAGIFETTIAAETETDLFGEQVVLCGGVNQLVIQAFETLVEAGYQPELAYFECLHELMLTVDLLHRGGVAYMRKMISNTAEFGDLVAGHKIIDSGTKDRMREILAEIQSSRFAHQWMQEVERGMPTLLQERRRTSELPIEHVGRELRARMPWLRSE